LYILCCDVFVTTYLVSMCLCSVISGFVGGWGGRRVLLAVSFREEVCYVSIMCNTVFCDGFWFECPAGSACQ
jgi:hypothetical protein